jgi:hypothetical protein
MKSEHLGIMFVHSGKTCPIYPVRIDLIRLVLVYVELKNS